MPTYDYKCNKCEHEFETFQSITAAPLKKCPECGANALQRLIGTGGGIIFKGGGFYQTDYRSESYKSAANAEKKAAAPPAETKDGKSTAAPPADKTPPKDASAKGDGGSDGAATARKAAPKKSSRKNRD